MNSENLKTFITLCKYKNFTRTAEALYVAQSTITNRIAELEREVNAQLFIRDKKSVQLTESGIKFLDYAKRIVDLEEKAISDISSDTRFEKSLTIGSTNTIFDCHINEKVKSFLQRKNDTAVKIVISHSLPLILNYSCTSGTASANGCALSDSCKADNLPSFPLKKRRTTPLDFQIFI